MSENIFSRIKARLARDYFRKQYLRSASHVERTAPLKPGTTPFILLSMVHQRDVRSYLVAAKSFSHFLNPARVVMVCDPTITADDSALLKAHIPHLEMRRSQEFFHAEVPVGGTWERLLAIGEYSNQGYVVQLDSDTVTCADIPEVRSAVESNTGFVLGEASEQQLLSLKETARLAGPRLSQNRHIQTRVEAMIASADLPTEAKYVRGCSGFTGFPVGCNVKDKLVGFSSAMQKHFFDDWATWGTEQITSNFVIANVAGTNVLPFPKYATPDVAGSGTSFIHFIGPMRFTSGAYRKWTEDALGRMPQS